MLRLISRRSPRRVLLVLALVAILATAGGGLSAPAASAAEQTAPIPVERLLPHTPADEGGTAIDNAEKPEWFLFAVLLGPFLVLVSGILWLTFRIDHSEGRS